MRLICGLLRLDGQAASGAVLDQMAAAMTAPGLTPRLARFAEGPIALGVLDFGGGAPVIEAEGDTLIAADMRLDGPDQGARGFGEALRRHGADFPDRIDGDFGVALWERQARTLWLGRDFIGARPLAWTVRPGQWLAFASLPKGLHGAGFATRAIDPVAQGVKLRQSFFRGSDSGFVEIAYLPAGHSLRIEAAADATPRLHRAYRPDPRRVGCWRGSAGEAAAVLRGLLDDAVRRRLPPQGLVACHLSGGLDSSAITVLAARAARERGQGVLALTMTTARPIGPAALDERPLIAAVLAQEADVAHVVVHDRLRLPGYAEDPDWPGSQIDGYDDRMMAQAAAFGADRVLSGVGGDEGATYNGANLYARLFLTGSFPTLLRELPARARRDGVSSVRAVWRRLVVPLLPRMVRRAIARTPSPTDPGGGILNFFAPRFRQAVIARSMKPILRSNRNTERVTAFVDHHLPSRCTYMAIMAARHGVAVSYPLLDRAVVDFMLSLPVRMFLSDGYSRQPFRRAMAGILPDPVRLAKDKVGLYDQRFGDYAPHKPDLLALVETLRRTAPDAAELFDLDAVAAGLATLPEAARDDASAPLSRASLAPGVPPWLPLIAVECLIAAHRLHRQESEGEGLALH